MGFFNRSRTETTEKQNLPMNSDRHAGDGGLNGLGIWKYRSRQKYQGKDNGMQSIRWTLVFTFILNYLMRSIITGVYDLMETFKIEWVIMDCERLNEFSA